MKTFVQWLLIVWFILLGLLVIVPSACLLYKPGADVTLLSPPQPPAPPEPISNGGIETNRLNAYAQQVAAYQQSVTAYGAYVEAMKKSLGATTYELVVKGTLGTMLGQLILGFLGFAFVKTSATVVDNMYRMKKGVDPRRLSLFE